MKIIRLCLRFTSRVLKLSKCEIRRIMRVGLYLRICPSIRIQISKPPGLGNTGTA